MSKRVPVSPDDLLGATEAIELIGLSRQRMSQLRREGNFPTPFVELTCGPIWLKADLEAWLKQRN